MQIQTNTNTNTVSRNNKKEIPLQRQVLDSVLRRLNIVNKKKDVKQTVRREIHRQTESYIFITSKEEEVDENFKYQVVFGTDILR